MSSSSRSGQQPQNGVESENGKESFNPDGQPQKQASRPQLLKVIVDPIKRVWVKLGIDWQTYKLMFKGALAPTIAIAAFQATPYAKLFTTVGYLVGIMAILSVVISPRAKFLQTMLVNILAACLGCAVALLAIFCCVKARINSIGFQGPGTGGPGTSGLASGGAETAAYNSSASAVAGVWLFVSIYGLSVFRAKMPQYTIPAIVMAIFANVSMVYAPQFSTMAQGEAFARHLLISMLVGFAIATGVSLLIFPVTSRSACFADTTGYIQGLRAAIGANFNYIKSLEQTDMFAAQKTNTEGVKPPRSPEAEAFKANMDKLAALHAKYQVDLPFAKREIAIGKLGPDDLQEIFRLLRLIMLPTLGLNSMSDIFEKAADDRGWDRSVDLSHVSADDANNPDERLRIEVINEWHELMRMLREPFGKITENIDEGLEHVLITLQLVVPAKPNNQSASDVESGGSDPRPGEKGFATFFDRRSQEFIKSKETMLKTWCRIHGIDLPDDFFTDPDSKNFTAPQWMQDRSLSKMHRILRRQLFLCLYLEFLLATVSLRVHQLIIAVDGLRDSEKLSKNRLIVPGTKRLKKWLISLLHGDRDTNGDSEIHTDGNTTAVYLGEAYYRQKDPEHLPPQTNWEHASDQLRKISHFFQSPASAFGFRCAVATISIAVINYLQETQIFFTTQRLFWAQIMVSISMSPSAGQSLRNFLLRIAGTCIAMIASWIAWYIVDGQTAGALVFYFFALHPFVWVLLKYPQYTPVGMIGQVTCTLIIGYTLQVRKIGIAEATSNGQAYYPIYELGPIRLATVCAGLFVAWFWTIFPYPISEHNQIRKGLGSSLYLLANYYSVMHETVRLRLLNAEGDINSKESPGRQLEKARYKIFTKTNLMISSLRTQSSFLKFDIPIGGRFPKEQYSRIIERLQTLLNFMALVTTASFSFTHSSKPDGLDHAMQWLVSFRKLVGQVNITSEQVTTTLSLLSACVTNGQALPPYLRVPEPFLLAERLDELDRDLLSIRHIAEPGYASFAVVQIGTKCIIDELKQLTTDIKGLVGELDFSYHIVSTIDPSRNSSAETLRMSKPERTESARSKLD